LDIKIIRLETEKLIIPSSSPTVTLGQLPFSPRAKRVIELAGKARELLHNDVIGTENLLMGCMMENESIAYQVLTNLGVLIDDLCARINKLVNAPELKIKEEEKNASVTTWVPVKTKGSQLSDAEICRRNNWTSGTILESIENGNRTVIQITAVGFEAILARELSCKGNLVREKERDCILNTQEWSRI
jgi:ATP-dependent Clp protease ATP-binding subunit ClpA